MPAPVLPAPATSAPLAWLLPVTCRPPHGVRRDDVGPVGWQVLVRDGVLEPVWGEVAAATGRTPDPALRAAAVRALVPPRAVLGRAGAVWVHTGGPPPPRFDVLVGPRVRRPSPHPARVPHECPLPPGDVDHLGDVRVTTVMRTALDVARWLAPVAAGALLHRLVVHAALDADAVQAAAARSGDRRLPGRLRAAFGALEAPGRADGQDGVVPATPAALEPVMR